MAAILSQPHVLKGNPAMPINQRKLNNRNSLNRMMEAQSSMVN